MRVFHVSHSLIILMCRIFALVLKKIKLLSVNVGPHLLLLKFFAFSHVLLGIRIAKYHIL